MDKVRNVDVRMNETKLIWKTTRNKRRCIIIKKCADNNDNQRKNKEKH